MYEQQNDIPASKGQVWTALWSRHRMACQYPKDRYGQHCGHDIEWHISIQRKDMDSIVVTTPNGISISKGQIWTALWSQHRIAYQYPKDRHGQHCGLDTEWHISIQRTDTDNIVVTNSNGISVSKGQIRTSLWSQHRMAYQYPKDRYGQHCGHITERHANTQRTDIENGTIWHHPKDIYGQHYGHSTERHASTQRTFIIWTAPWSSYRTICQDTKDRYARHCGHITKKHANTHRTNVDGFVVP